MDEKKIEAGDRLKVIGRAGVGVDNIDLPAASRRGIIVINAPSGNTLAATELTMANMLAVVRMVPQACASLHAGKWNRNKFTGRQLSGKKLLVIGHSRALRRARRIRHGGRRLRPLHPAHEGRFATRRAHERPRRGRISRRHGDDTHAAHRRNGEHDRRKHAARLQARSVPRELRARRHRRRGGSRAGRCATGGSAASRPMFTARSLSRRGTRSSPRT